jgi:hypothetical protein
MKREKATKSPEEQYFRALALLDDTTKYLKNAGCDPALMRTVTSLVKYLRDKETSDICTILGNVEPYTATLTNLESPQETDEQLASLTADQLRQKITDLKLSRNYLERIAKIRFGVTTGALSTLRTKESLIDKLLTMTANEATHDSITKLASSHKQD